MKLPSASVEDHLAAAPAAALPLLRKLRSLARKAAPGAEERISYGMPAVFVDGRILLYYAAFKDHVGVYPPPRGDAAFMKAIAPYAGPKGNLSFPIGAKIPEALLRAIIDARLAAVRLEASAKTAVPKQKSGKGALSKAGVRPRNETSKNTESSKPASEASARKTPRQDTAPSPHREGAEGSFARRLRWPMPLFVKRALKESGLNEAYRERPPYQRNDYIGWITQAKTTATQLKRLAQMLDELERGGVYMRMKHAASAKPRVPKP